MLPKLSDFGLAQRPDGPELLRYPIQPPLFQAPEVILGIGWSYSADIWNLGVLAWNLLEDRELFRDIRSEGAYDSRKHLAEMIALLGPPPKEVFEREQRWSMVPWRCSFQTAEGKHCWPLASSTEGHSSTQMNLYTGEFLYKDLIPYEFNLSDSVHSLNDNDKHLFLDFVGQMLQWLPENRKTAKELLKHPWLGLNL
ncbi:uncharacterized protein BP5553_07387 [Venustampulla echinocandica]|uniref:Protein kinase domain-containing protein n=1 Tax=Venustampulla echinocandica TaxID=2656787 RepID=A0A370TJD0_9HELO|nr:uncharacterized protein BP5553_07387 [Venustampulla echinocandica]RDL35456.1 hypothetical protein BP5553_07387 [Venustampulla echinocandica]